MLFEDNDLQNEQDKGSEQSRPNAYRVEDDDNEDEKDLTRFDDKRPISEGEPMGGQNFGSNNVTRAGNDPANPAKNSGNSNGYFKRTEPAEEHPENSNFKPGEQAVYNEGTVDNDGEADDKPNIPGPGELPDQQKVGEE